MGDSGITMTIRGDREVAQKLQGFEAKIARKHLRTALRAGAQPILAAAKAAAPVRTGELQKRIKIMAGKSRKGLVSVLVSTGKSLFKGKAFYAGFVEFGHLMGKRLRTKFKSRAEYNKAGIAAGKRFVPGKHFMQRGLESQQENAVGIIENTLAALIEEEWKS